jgi:hypothetical protein
VSSLFSRTQGPQSQSWWRSWGIIAVGALAIAGASAFLFRANVQTTPQMSAEEVVGGMDDLLAGLDSYDPVRMIYQEAAEETRLNWREDLSNWPAGSGRDLRSW